MMPSQPRDLIRSSNLGERPFHAGLLGHRQQSFLAASIGLEQARKIATLPGLGDTQFHGIRPGVPISAGVAVAVGNEVWVSFPMMGAVLRRHLGSYNASHRHPQAFP